ncbi:DUF3768 domain-containing protein [Rhizobium sp. CB3060]|uniref:DUF3768 domain-containing protein n=1 Tax=Rhizobium sp. CB3060 TaxID=3138255 RepID=UPI0021A4A315|nr:DUF3768 domain-containing protein [Rhizobium tropici]UWU20928.1 DUF3768 domain-containing protein [Rhizobium tropici]
MTASPIDPTDAGHTGVTTKIRMLNDAFRRSPRHGGLMVTAGVSALSADQLVSLFRAVRDFDNFDAGNDPFNEHDFGAVDFDGATYFWKIDYYDLDRRYGSPDPSNPDVTSRVLTIMRADEY